jgi:heme exporter protein B
VWRDASLVLVKDLRVEWRSRVLFNQTLPLGILILVLFAFALDPARETVLRPASPGLFWVAVIFVGVLAAQRSAAIETADGVRDATRLSGLDPAGMFLGKAGALAVELLGLEVALGLGVAVMYPVYLRASGLAVMVVTVVATTIGLAAASTIYGALVAGYQARESLLPLLIMPIVAPILIGATRALESAFATTVDRKDLMSTVNPSDGWPWVGLLGVFALVYVAAGLLAYGPLLEDS